MEIKNLSFIDSKNTQSCNIKHSDLCRAALNYADLLYLADTDHLNAQFRNLVLGPETMKACAEAGASHVLLEIADDGPGAKDILRYSKSTLSPQELVKQDLGDNFDKFKTQYPQLVELLKSQVEHIQNLSGFNIHCVDPQQHEEKSKLRNSMNTGNIIARLNLDPKLSKNIRNAIPKGDKAVMFYGDLHGSRLDDGIGGSSTKPEGEISTIQINIYPDRKTYDRNQALLKAFNAEAQEKKLLGQSCFHEDLPEAVYFMDTKTVYFSPEAPEVFVKNVLRISQSQKNDSIPLKQKPEESRSATKSLKTPFENADELNPSSTLKPENNANADNSNRNLTVPLTLSL